MFEKNEIMKLSGKDWRRKVYYDFSKDLTSTDQLQVQMVAYILLH